MEDGSQSLSLKGNTGATEVEDLSDEDNCLPQSSFSDICTLQLLLEASSRSEKQYVQTTPIQDLENLMFDERVVGVTVIGNRGDGKTVASKIIAWHLYRRLDYEPKEVRSIQDIIDTFDPQKRILFIVDDPFGAYRRYEEFFMDWVSRLSELDKYLSTGSVKILVTMRRHIWEECKWELKNTPPFDTVFDMTSSRLTVTDKMKLLKCQLDRNDIDTDSWDWKWKIERLGVLGSSLYFPLCCQLVAEGKGKFQDKIDFLENPSNIIREELHRIVASRPQMLSALTLLMLNGGTLKFSDLDPLATHNYKSLKYKLEDIISTSGLSSPPTVQDSLIHVRYSLETMTGTFLKNTNNKYEFIHTSVLEAVAKECGDLSPSLLLKHAKPEVVIRTVTAHLMSTQDNSNHVAITRELFPSLATIITYELATGHTESVLSNSSWQDPVFQEIWEELMLTDVNKNSQMLISESHVQRNILHYAVQKGILRLVKFFNAYSLVDIKAFKDENGITLLHSAVIGGHTKVVEYLLKMGFDPNVQENAGWTPLYLATLCGHAQIVRSLLMAKADPNKATPYGSYPVFLAELCQNKELVSLLRFWGAKSITSGSSQMQAHGFLSVLSEPAKSHISALLEAVRARRAKDVMSLLDCGIGVDETNGWGWSSLYLAAVCGHEDIASLLLHKGAKPCQPTPYGRTPAYIAKVKGLYGIVKMIDSFESGLIRVQ